MTMRRILAVTSLIAMSSCVRAGPRRPTVMEALEPAPPVTARPAAAALQGDVIPPVLPQDPEQKKEATLPGSAGVLVGLGSPVGKGRIDLKPVQLLAVSLKVGEAWERDVSVAAVGGIAAKEGGEFSPAWGGGACIGLTPTKQDVTIEACGWCAARPGDSVLCGLGVAGTPTLSWPVK